MATLPAAAIEGISTLSLYNSPYPAHDDGCAVDLYPGNGTPDFDSPTTAPSPVSGTIVETRTVSAPTRAYAASEDHLIVIDTGERLARVLHVDPGVQSGDAVTVGDTLGRLVRSGYFAPWVGGHLHLEFRPREADPYRASGSLPISLGLDVEPVSWDGRGSVIERGETFAVLDAPSHPAPGRRFAGIAADPGVLDGGLPHYPGGGRLGGSDGPVSLAGEHVGVAEGRTVRWESLEVCVNGHPITGISLSARRDRLGVKLVSWDGVPVPVGERVEVSVHRT